MKLSKKLVKRSLMKNVKSFKLHKRELKLLVSLNLSMEMLTREMIG